MVFKQGGQSFRAKSLGANRPTIDPDRPDGIIQECVCGNLYIIIRPTEMGIRGQVSTRVLGWVSSLN